MIDRETAAWRGERFYQEPRGCHAGHTPAIRYVSTGNCVACMKQRYNKSPRMKPRSFIIPAEMHAAVTATMFALGCVEVRKGPRGGELAYIPTLTPAEQAAADTAAAEHNKQLTQDTIDRMEREQTAPLKNHSGPALPVPPEFEGMTTAEQAAYFLSKP